MKWIHETSCQRKGRLSKKEFFSYRARRGPPNVKSKNTTSETLRNNALPAGLLLFVDDSERERGFGGDFAVDFCSALNFARATAGF